MAMEERHAKKKKILGCTPISISHPSVAVTTNLESARSTVLFNLKLGALSDDEPIGPTGTQAGHSVGG